MASGTKCTPFPTALPETGVLIGYARVSTEDQKLDIQRDALGSSAATACSRIVPPVHGPIDPSLV